MSEHDLTDTELSALAAIPAKYAQPDPSIVSLLPKGGDKSNKANCKECGGYHPVGAVHLDYVGHADITLQLIEIDPEWSWEPFAIDTATGLPKVTEVSGQLTLWGRMTLCGHSRIGVGTCDVGKPEAHKELVGDFLRNAAMRFGIGTKLWSKADRVQDDAPAQAAPRQQHREEYRPAPQAAPSAPASAPSTAPTPKGGGSGSGFRIPGKGRNGGKSPDDLSTSELESEFLFWRGKAIADGPQSKWYEANMRGLVAMGSVLHRRTGMAYPTDSDTAPFLPNPDEVARVGVDETGCPLPF